MFFLTVWSKTVLLSYSIVLFNANNYRLLKNILYICIV